MLNKGEHILEAVRFLDHILHKMQAHHLKKRSMLRRLAVAQMMSRNRVATRRVGPRITPSTRLNASHSLAKPD